MRALAIFGFGLMLVACVATNESPNPPIQLHGSVPGYSLPANWSLLEVVSERSHTFGIRSGEGWTGLAGSMTVRAKPIRAGFDEFGIHLDDLSVAIIERALEFEAGERIVVLGGEAVLLEASMDFRAIPPAVAGRQIGLNVLREFDEEVLHLTMSGSLDHPDFPAARAEFLAFCDSLLPPALR